MSQAVEEPDIRRDGVSQAERQLAALSPDYVSVDERSTKDLLDFAKAYAADLNFFDVQNEQVQATAAGWSHFFAGVNLDEALAYLESSEKFTPEAAQPYARPHFALFLTFLELLQHAQDQLNGLTKRHLDYYYQQVLRLSKRGSIPDQVNVLVELAPRIKQFALPAGALLNAGTDSQGQNLVYRTDRAITANQAQVDKLHTLFADRSAVGLPDIWENKDIPDKEAIMRLLEMSLGDPAPGDPLPPYPLLPTDLERRPITYDDDNITELETLYHLADFVPGELYLEFEDYRKLVGHKDIYDALDSGWETINQILTKAGQTKISRTGENYEFKITNPKDFESNLKNALNFDNDAFEDLFDGIPGVVTLKDAYSNRFDSQVRAKINTKLYLPVDETDPNGADGLTTFTAMMQLLIPIESNWEEIIRILTLARQTKIVEDEDFKPDPPDMPDIALKDIESFDEIIKRALGLDFDDPVPYPSPFVGDPITALDNHYLHLLTLETYFYMAAEDFHYFMTLALAVAGRGDDGDEVENDGSTGGNRQITPEWEKVFSILDEAHKKKIYADRKATLRDEREVGDGFDAMLYLALGIDDPDESQDPLDLLGQYSISQENMTFLEEMRSNADTIEDNDDQWEKTYQIAERIQRVILPEPIPQIETWRNLHPLEDAKSAVVKLGVEGEAESTRWQTFGQAMTNAGSPDPTFGWAISSPILALSQGTRTITLTLGFDQDTFPTQTDDLTKMFATADTVPFLIEISTEKGWIPVNIDITTDPILVDDYRTLTGPENTNNQGQEPLRAIQFTLKFGEDVDSLTVLPPEDNPFDSPWPILRLMMQAVATDTDEDDRTTPYLTFKELILRRVHLTVDVKKLQPSHIQNDEGVLKPGKPFEPFGLRPAVGSRFYLSHPELVNKKLDSLDFIIEWMGVPNNLKSYYTNYIPKPANSPLDFNTSIVADNSGFKTQVSLVDHRVALPLTTPEEPSSLFENRDATQPRFIPIKNIPEAIAKNLKNYKRLLNFNTIDAVTAWDRYVQWELKFPDFQHNTYPGRATQLSVNLAVAIKTIARGEESNYQINPPYTPKIKGLTLNYTSSLEIEVQNYQTGQEADQLYHIQPFGYSECQPETKLAGAMFLPQFDYEGELYIGLRDLGMAQTLSLLFQMAEGSANPDLPVEPVRWHYLSGNRWLSLEQGRLLEDGTRGLINSGIVRFKLEAARPNTLLDPELYWLRAAIRRHSNSVCDAIDIHTQAVSATFVDQDNAPDHLSRPLPPETITKLVKRKAQVAAIHQPYTSYGGKMPEQDETFYTRLSERLRHKNRALAQWDYEHLILDRFPQIYKVKCLPATPAEPGQVNIVVIPDIRNNDLFDPFEPKAPANVIADIEAYLADRTPAHARVTVKNAHYVPVKVRFAVRFQPGTDEGYAKQQLNDELNRFLSPWAYDEGGDIVIGGRIYANVIINFIEERPYVDFVAEIRLFKSEKPIRPTGTQGYWVEPDNPDGVLVAARRHEIDIITEAGYEEENFKGINYMRIELDFVVG